MSNYQDKQEPVLAKPKKRKRLYTKGQRKELKAKHKKKKTTLPAFGFSMFDLKGLPTFKTHRSAWKNVAVRSG